MYKVPAIPTENGQADQQADYQTTALGQELRSVREIPYSQPSYTRDFILSSGIADSDYNPGYKQVPVDNQVSFLTNRYESPEVPVSQLPYNQSIYNSSISQPSLPVQKFNLRSPGINEGF